MIPARPFMDALQKHPDELAEFSQQAASNLNTAETVASAIGAQASSMIQDAIRDEDWTPNAPVTVEGGWMVNEYGKNGPVPVHIDGKGSTKPLIDTGTMRQQCGFRLVKGEKYSERRDVPATIYLSISAPFSDLVLSILGTHDLVVHPAGVRVRINCSTEDAETFGFVDLNPRVAGFGEGMFAQSIN